MTQRLTVKTPSQDFLYDLINTLPLVASAYEVTFFQGPKEPLTDADIEIYLRDCEQARVFPFSALSFHYSKKEGRYTNGTPTLSMYRRIPRAALKSGALDYLVIGGKIAELRVQSEEQQGLAQPEATKMLKEKFLPYVQKHGYEIAGASFYLESGSGSQSLQIPRRKQITEDGVILFSESLKGTLDKNLTDWFLDLKTRYQC